MTECRDCRAENLINKRPVVAAGRCASHSRAAKSAARLAAHGRMVERTYKLPRKHYWALYEAQGGKCWICQHATGAARRLPVDHDHSCCPKTPTCGKCTRGLLCGPCNRMLGHGRDSPEFFARAAAYLRRPPAQAVLLALD